MHPYYYVQNDSGYRQNEQLVRNIRKAINGEYSAIQCYERLALMAPNAKEKKQIQEIRQDESKHFHQFMRIYTSLTGKQHSPKIVEGCPNQYRTGLEFAFQDEQETVDFYLGISEGSNDPIIKETFRRAAADEQNHAVWFLYFLTNQPSRYRVF
ncbi:ferritin-like domain-containing protein [Mesobacillus zeae]|uniref:Ferritin-like domain-containing protein n=1 Tax=Mesobacillus zeae TaxID=1917180 RepID=A0A398B804_9BACI|nr:ferritin-like domain-containing protein [Mesobacillus zeae]RID85614.1 ferritin-like domain-containing protein [Mesobacillus zeae]